MWTPATRGRMAKIEKKTKRYPSDLTNEEWARIEPFLPRASKAGRPIEVDGSQAPHRGRHRRPSSDGQSDARRHLRQRRGSDDPGRCAQALAVAEASVRRRGL